MKLRDTSGQICVIPHKVPEMCPGREVFQVCLAYMRDYRYVRKEQRLP
jgi:hypothetical protein